MFFYSLTTIYILSVLLSLYFMRRQFTMDYERREEYYETSIYAFHGFVCFVPIFNLVTSLKHYFFEKRAIREEQGIDYSLFDLFIRKCFVHKPKQKQK